MKIRRPWTWLAVGGVSGALLLKFAWPSWAALLPPCTVLRMTGLYCPGCGGTRCAGRLLKGDLRGALSMNAAVALLALVAGLLVAFAVLRESKGRPDAMPLLPAWFAWTLVGFVVAFGLVRNLPWWPFTLLVPH